MDSEATDASPIVLPSGAARALASVPTFPPEPDRFSTTQGCPVISAMRLHQMRESKSVDPPAGKVTMKRMGPVGHSDCPKAGAASSAAPKPKALRRVVPDMLPLFALWAEFSAMAGREAARVKGKATAAKKNGPKTVRFPGQVNREASRLGDEGSSDPFRKSRIASL
jgi:hypothetical protein